MSKKHSKNSPRIVPQTISQKLQTPLLETPASFQQKSGILTPPPKKPPNLIPRTISFLALIFISFLNFGNFYIFDLPEDLAEETISEYDIPQTQLNLMYTFYYTPGIVVLIFASKISGWLTSSLASLVASFIVFAGSVVTNYGFEVNNFNIVLLGRFIFGIGGELLVVLGGCLVEEWFKGGKLTLASSLMEMLSLAAVACSNYVTLPLYTKYRSIAAPYLFGSFICSACLVLNLIFYFMDNYKVKKFSRYLSRLKAKLKILEKKVDEEDQDFNHIARDNQSIITTTDAESVTVRLSNYPESTYFNKTVKSSGLASDFDSVYGFTLGGQSRASEPYVLKKQSSWEEIMDGIIEEINDIEVIFFINFYRIKKKPNKLLHSNSP